MAGPVVSFAYYPGVGRFPAGAEADLCGSWALDGTPRPGAWSRHPMTRAWDETGAACFTAEVAFDQAAVGVPLLWGSYVRLGGGAAEVWGVAAETPDLTSTDQVRPLMVAPPSAGGPQRESYRLSWHRARGAQRYLAPPGTVPPGTAPPGLRFSVWAPGATAVEVVFGQPGGYLAADGYGADPGQAAVPLRRGADGIWAAAVGGISIQAALTMTGPFPGSTGARAVRSLPIPPS
jgi:1,4-alpha-glucan branching enzyme